MHHELLRVLEVMQGRPLHRPRSPAKFVRVDEQVDEKIEDFALEPGPLHFLLAIVREG